MKKTFYMIELLLGKPMKEASNEKVLKLLALLVSELTLIKAHKAWVGRTKKGLSSRRVGGMAQMLYREARRRMDKSKKNKSRR